MRRPFLFTLFLLSLLLVATAAVFVFRQLAIPPPVATPGPDELAAVPRVSVDVLDGQLRTSAPPLVWDFRPTTSFAEGHIPGSRVLTLDAVPDAAANVDKGQAIVTVCAWPDEHTSARAALILQNLGFTNVEALKGGIDAWNSAGYPVVTGEQ